jgi:tetratricopeptide (TPR) repeat protein
VRSPLPIDGGERHCLAAHSRVRPDTLHAAMMESQLAYLDGIGGRLPAARTRYERVMAVLRRHGAERYAAAYMFDWGLCEMLGGRVEDALARFEDARETALDLDAVFAAEATALRARALARLGCPADAWSEAHAARDKLPPSNVEAQAWWRIAAASAAGAQGRSGDAERLAREALRIAGDTQAPQLQGDTLSCAGEVLLVDGRLEGEDLLREAIALYEAKGIAPAAAAARELLDDHRSAVA